MPSTSINENGNQHIRVFIADTTPFDCQLVADSLGRNHLRVIGWAVDSNAAVAGIIEHEPEVALISSRMHDGELAGFEALRQLRSSGSKSRVIMLLDDSDPQLVVAAFRNGASGVFSRKRRSTELRKCIRCISAGEIWARNQEVLFIVEALQKPAAAHISNSKGIALLTRREGDVVGLVVNGLTNRAIARELGLSEHTVKNYMFEIFEKLGISTRVELVLYALNHNGHKPVLTDTNTDGIGEERLEISKETA